MKAVIIHNHTIINIPRKGKQIEPNKEQMLELADKQINRLQKQIINWEKIKEVIQRQEMI